jgi:hypothetical protein
MQASQARNETRLPRAVLKRSQAIDARLQAQNEPNGDEATLPSAVPEAEPPAVELKPSSDERDSDPAYWKQRANVNAGFLQRERSERKAEQASFNQQIAELQSQIRALQDSVPRPESAIDLSRFFTAEQIEALGEDECRVMASTAVKAAADQVKATVAAELQPLKDAQKLSQEQSAKAAQDGFVDKLSELVPDYAAIDVEQGWRDWLAQENDDGVQRQMVLDTHVGALNATKVAKMFKDYKASLAPTPKPPVTPSGTGAAPNNDAPRNPRGLVGLTGAEVKEFYTRAALGKVTDAQRVEFEARMKLPRR